MTYTINNYKITSKDFDYMINLLKQTQKMYKEMNFKSNLGNVLGAASFLFVCKTF